MNNVVPRPAAAIRSPSCAPQLHSFGNQSKNSPKSKARTDEEGEREEGGKEGAGGGGGGGERGREGGGRRREKERREAEGGDRAAYNPNLLSLSAITFTIDLWAAGKNGGGAINYKTPMRSTANRRARYTC